MAAIGLEVVGSKVRTSKMPQQLRRRRGLGPLVIRIFVGSCKHQQWQHLGQGGDRLVSTAGIIFYISPYSPAAGHSATHVRADWLLDWSLAAKWARLLITYLAASYLTLRWSKHNEVAQLTSLLRILDLIPAIINSFFTGCICSSLFGLAQSEK